MLDMKPTTVWQSEDSLMYVCAQELLESNLRPQLEHRT